MTSSSGRAFRDCLVNGLDFQIHLLPGTESLGYCWICSTVTLAMWGFVRNPPDPTTCDLRLFASLIARRHTNSFTVAFWCGRFPFKPVFTEEVNDERACRSYLYPLHCNPHSSTAFLLRACEHCPWAISAGGSCLYALV